MKMLVLLFLVFQTFNIAYANNSELHYTVKKGDYLSGIVANIFKASDPYLVLPAIKKLNPGLGPLASLRVGQKIILPSRARAQKFISKKSIRRIASLSSSSIHFLQNKNLEIEIKNIPNSLHSRLVNKFTPLISTGSKSYHKQGLIKMEAFARKAKLLHLSSTFKQLKKHLSRARTYNEYQVTLQKFIILWREARVKRGGERA